MAQKSFFWTTSSAGDGATPYTRSDLSTAFAVLAAVHNHEGVAPSFLNALAATVPAANAVRINTGGAVVDGRPYINDAQVDITIPSAVGAGNTRIDRVVLRADWTSQTVRLTRIAGVDAASPTAPAITQTPGATYDIPLYRVTVNTSGVVTVSTDERLMGRVAIGGIVDGAQIGMVTGRMGASASNWMTATPRIANASYPTDSTPSQSVASVDMQVGVAQLTPPTGEQWFFFHHAFAAPPVVLIQGLLLSGLPGGGTGIDYDEIIVRSTEATRAFIYVPPTIGYDMFFWLAIGPKA